MSERFVQDDGQQVFTGSELLVKGALETADGVHLFTGVPGPPLVGYFDALDEIAPLLAEHGQAARPALDGPSAVALVNGAQMAGCRSLATLGAAALSAAAEALTRGVMAGTRGGSGAVIVCGDDSWQDATSVPIDARLIAEQARLPLLEPAGPQEVKDWVDLAFRLGRASGSYVGLLLTTALAAGGGTVQPRKNQWPKVNQKSPGSLSYRRDLEPWLDRAAAGPGAAGITSGTTASRAALCAEARRLGLNRIVNRPHKGEIAPLGFIAAGAAYATLAHALAQLDVAGRLPILKLGLTYPVDQSIVTDLARQCRRLVVIEEGRDFVERQVLRVLGPLKLSGEWLAEVYGKRFPGSPAAAGIPEHGGLHPSMLIERIIPLLRDHPTILASSLSNREADPLVVELGRVRRTAAYEVRLPQRTPTFCAGCPQRDTSSILLELRDELLDPQYMLAKHKRKPVELICHGDAGCSSLLRYEPTRPLLHSSAGQGLGGAAAAGVEPFVENKQLVFMGDGTFFQSGQSAIGHSVQSGRDVTYVIQANQTAAPAKVGQPAAGNGVAARIQRIIEGMIPKRPRQEARVVRINPEDRVRYRNLLEQMVLADGVNIVIADKACGLTRQRLVEAERRRNEANPVYPMRRTYMNIDPEVCDDCRQCVRMTGCPGLTLADTSHGRKIQIDQSTCVNDRACQRVAVCPAFEQVTVVRYQAPRRRHEYLAGLPEPARPIHAEQETWRCFVPGVGGMGVGVTTSILAAAGDAMGYRVQFARDKGAAIRSGSTFSQLVYMHNGHDNDNAATTASIPYGSCDLILGLDLLEAVAGLDPARRYRVAGTDRTAVVVNAVATPTVTHLMGLDDVDAAALDRTLRRYSHPDRYCSFDLAELSRRVLGSTRYVNVMLLGMACQSGFLPLRREVLEQAITAVLPDDTERNLRAFGLGRTVVADRQRVEPESSEVAPTPALVYRRRAAALRERFGRRRGAAGARRVRRLVHKTRLEMGASGRDPALLAEVIAAVYDCFTWGGVEYAQRYCRQLVGVAQRDVPARDFQLTRTVARNLAKVMLIRDEVYVSALLTSAAKRRRDRQRFNVDLEAGDQIIYRWAHRPEFNLFGRRFRFDWTSRQWHLRLMSRLGWLRRLIPQWHGREQQFRQWYERLIEQVDSAPGESARAYQRWVAILGTPDLVSGYREVAYPKMLAARRQAEKLLSIDPEFFDPPASAHQVGEEARVEVGK